MNLRRYLHKRTLLIIAFVVIVLLSAVTFQTISNDSPRVVSAPQPTNATTQNKTEKVRPGLPVRLKIPKINVNAAIEYVGLTPQGEMGAPKDLSKVAWFNLGPRPGEKGDSVIDGHFGWVKNTVVVFNDLDKLQKGDKIYVQDDKGASVTFVVQSLRSYGKTQDTSGVFLSSDQKAHLNLITCEGVWSETQKTYSGRLVVFSDKD
jgi:LPXTG-site transpeptidase (sortase) family protein